jgi:FSR family fosmidomycin resistance protein-like MFS transporter
MADGITEPAAANVRSLDTVSLGMLAAGHLSVDLCQGAVPAMLPFLVQERGLTYAAAGGLVLAQTASSSVVQPIFGQLSDRRSSPWLLPAGVATAAVGVGIATLLPSYPLIWLAIAVSGIGVAAYHPDGARYANFASGTRRATGMSYFAVGGNLGFATGPIVATPVLLLFGLQGGWLIGILPLVIAGALLIGLRRIESHRGHALARSGIHGQGRDDWPAFGRLTVALLARSVVFYGLNTFIPLFWVAALGQSKAAGGFALSLFLLTGVVGTLAGGRLADRFSKKWLVLAGFAFSAPLIAVVALIRAPWLADVALVPTALALYAPASVMTLYGQELLPSRMGFASGVTLGLSLSFGGVMAPVVGRIGDAYGLPAAVLLMAALPAAALPLVLSLPDRMRAR